LEFRRKKLGSIFVFGKPPNARVVSVWFVSKVGELVLAYNGDGCVVEIFQLAKLDKVDARFGATLP
jgi:hypothetical protein